MSNQLELRLIIDPPQPGAWNMAVDESLMQSVGSSETEQPAAGVLRFYQWDEPTLSLGYFQKERDRSTHSPSESLPMVRRNSGGGAIIHHLELTYSLTISESVVTSIFGNARELYVLMHTTLIASLGSFGVEATLVSDLEKDLESKFLCFLRRAPNDVLVSGRKVCGGAQRKKFDSVSQHGSVIVQTSEFAPEIIGINDMSGSNLSVSGLQERWIEGISGRLRCSLEPSTLTNTEAKRAQELCEGKFASVTWNSKR